MFLQEFEDNVEAMEKINSEIQMMLDSLGDRKTKKRHPGVTSEQLTAYTRMVKEITVQAKELLNSMNRVKQNIEKSNDDYMETQSFMRDYEKKFNVTLPPFIRKAWQV